MKILQLPIALAFAALGLVSCGRSARESGASPVGSARPGPAPEFRVEGEDLAMLAGNWQGELEYLDFSDNRTKSTIKATLRSTYSAPDRKLSINLSFVEPNGKLIEDQASLELAADGRQILFDHGEWTVTRKQAGQSPDIFILGFERDGADNNQNARLRNTITLTGDHQFKFTREARYPDGESFFTRSTYRFTRSGK